MLQRAANNAYSWWWVSHIRTKQSKWLEQNLEDMEDKVGTVLKLIEEDGDSFRKRAEMYYKKRPELISFVEESYRAYRALAERYDHLSKELQNANHTIATVFPDRVHYGVEYDDDEAACSSPGVRRRPLEAFRPESPRDQKLPVADLKGLVRATTKKFEGKSMSNVAASGSGGGRLVVASSGLSKQEGMQEIDRLQRRILALQTEKEYVTNKYESSLSKYWELEKEVEELQERVSGLQDEFGAGMVIEDDEARKLMAETVLRSCQETLSELQKKQDKSAAEAKLESRRIEDARGKLNSFKNELVQDESVRTEEESNVSVHEAVGAAEARNSESLKAKIKEDFEVEFHGSLSVSQMADKIDELVSKVMTLETGFSSQTVQIQSLQTETDDLHSQIRALEDDKAALLDNKNELREQLKKMEGKWGELQSLNQSIEEENYNLQTHLTEAQCNLEHLSEKLHSVQQDEEPEAKGKYEKSTVFETNPDVGLKNLKDMKPDEKHEEASLEQQEINDKLASVQTVEESSDKHASVQTAEETDDKHDSVQAAKETTDKGVLGQSEEESILDQQEIDDKVASVQIAEESSDKHASLQNAEETADKHASVQTAESSEERSLEQQEIDDKLASEQTAEEYADKHALVQTVKEIDDKQASEQTAEEARLEQQESDDNLASVQTSGEISDKHASVQTTEETSDKRAPGQAAKETLDMHALLETADSLHKVEEQKDPPVETSRNENEAIDYRQQIDDKQVSSSTDDDYPKFNQEESLVLRRGNGDEMGCTSNETEGSLEQQETTEKLASTETDDNVPHSGLQESAVGREDEPDWRQLFLNGMNDREKVLLSEYTAVLRDYNETKKMLSELEARNQTSILEITIHLNDAKKENSAKEEEILRLHHKLKLLEEELSQRSQCICQNLINKHSSESTAACIETKSMEDEEEMVIPFVRPQTTSPLEEKFRTCIDKLLEENLNFWLKFSTSFSLIQKFDTEVIDLRGEVSNLKERHNQEGSSRSKYSLQTDVRPTYKHLREVQTELALWLEKNVLLKDEVRQRSASLRNTQDEIMKAMKQSAEDDEFTFTSYQVAKFQGEILNMKQENKRVAEELQAGLDHVKVLLIEVERNLAKMGEEFGLSGTMASGRFQDGVTRSRIPLRTFLFGAKEKKRRSAFSFMHPALYRKNTTRRW